MKVTFLGIVITEIQFLQGSESDSFHFLRNV